MENIETNVLEFFKKHLKNIEFYDSDTIINFPDLLVDDAEIILEEFMKKFNIKESHIDLDKYFNPLKNPLIRLFDLLKSNKRIQKKPIIRISHLIEVAKNKEWFEPS